MAEPLKPLWLLALAGGGVRVLSALGVLDRIMKEIARKTGKEGQELRPCDYFGLIGGTSAGGIAAIMLGKVKMTVPQCIIAFKKLSELIFKNGRKRALWPLKFRYKSSYLINAVKEVLREQSLPEDELLYESPENDCCRTFVTALPADCVTEHGAPILFRSYPAPNSRFEIPNVKVHEAVRATTAAPRVFKSSHIDGYEFLDAALANFNDPSSVVEDEAKQLWPGRQIDVFLSLGAGKRETIGLGDCNIFSYCFRLLKILKNTATGGVTIATQLEKRLGRDVFFRFNSDNGLGNIDIADWKKLEKIEMLTNKYLEELDTIEKIDRLVQRIVNEITPVTVTQQLLLDHHEQETHRAQGLAPRSLRIINDGDSTVLPKFPTLASQTNFSYIATNHPSIFERITKGYKSHSEAVKSYSQMQSFINGHKIPEASISRVHCVGFLRKSRDELATALGLLAAHYETTEEHNAHAWDEAEAIKLKLQEVHLDSKSFLSSDPDTKCAEILKEYEIKRGMVNLNPNPRAIHSGRCRKISRTTRKSGFSVACIAVRPNQSDQGLGRREINSMASS